MPPSATWLLSLSLLLLASPASADQCDTNRGVISCGDFRNTDVNASFWDWLSAGWLQSDSYNTCTTKDYDNPEDAWIFTCASSGSVTVDLTNLECDVDLMILDDICDGDVGCMERSARGGSSPESITFDCDASHIYYLIVERDDDDIWPPWGDCTRFDDHDYSIEVTCHEECDDGFDNDGDNYIDCFDDDCPPCQEDCYDGFDNDFDGLADCDDPDCADLNDCCDIDNDGYRATGGVCLGDDCNDNPITNGQRVHPGANEEIGDGIDSDCNGLEKCYVDLDGDFYGVPTEVESAIFTCLGPDIANNADDCDDTNPDINPGLEEVVANGQDDDCDGFELCFLDDDNDDFGSDRVIDSTDLTCTLGVNSLNNEDCDDFDAAVYPGATEIPVTGKDEDCDGTELCYVDADNDAYGVDTTQLTTNITCIGIGISIRNDDCDDTPGTGAVINPDAREGRADGVDQNCDGFEECWEDADLDTWGNDNNAFIVTTDLTCTVPGGSLNELDCDDDNPTIYPGALDPPGDGVDQDCNDLQDCYQDLDGDGFGSDIFVESSAPNCLGVGIANVPGDCDDTIPVINPDAVETANDGVDQDCDGRELCFIDQDADGYGATDLISSPDLTCLAPGVAPNDDDCNDVPPLGANINPGQVEDPSTPYDDNCDELFPCFQDLDNDGFGNNTVIESSSESCDLAGTSPNNLDCDDSPTGFRINPDVAEVPVDGVDQNCDGQERCYRDLDQDGFGVDIFTLSNDLTCRDAGVAHRNDDCDDDDPDIYPGSTDGYNCGDEYPCFLDQDLDGFGGQIVELVGDPTCSAPGYSQTDDDCNDNPATGGAAINPNAFETANDQLDSDCDGFELCHQDNDGDGFGTINLQLSADLTCNSSGVSRFDTDCNDNPSADGATTYPGAPELTASGADENCDGEENCWRDQDGDDYGWTTIVTTPDITCRGGLGYIDNNEDCDDRLADVNPGAVDTPGNSRDENCDGFDQCYQDLDEDGYGTLTEVTGTDPGLTCQGAGLSANALDCYDVPPDGALVYPGAPEIPGNGRDDDCNGLELCFNDADSDGFGNGAAEIESPNLLCTSGGLSPTGDDCNDLPITGATIYPGATETVADGIDQNCDGEEDCYQDLDRDHYGSLTVTSSPALDCVADGVSLNSDDCYDLPPTGATIYPGANEITGNGIDENCDGSETCWIDADADGYGFGGGTVDSPTLDCSAVGMSSTADDCRDDNPAIHPNAPEIPADVLDQDCDGQEDCYRDADGDAFGVSVIVPSAALTCTAVGVANNDDDCDDSLPGGNFVYPGAPEIPGNGIDENCDGGEDCYIDADGDGYGGTATTTTPSYDCSAPDATRIGGDCEDANALINPDAVDIPANGIDEDCDGGDTCYQDVDGDGYGSDLLVASPDMSCLNAGESDNQADCLDRGTDNNVSAADIHPNADELCNLVDDDCDGAIDDDDLSLADGFEWYRDQDGDGFGQDNLVVSACSEPDGYVTDDGDCNDGAPAINPDAQEICDPNDVDEDCDGQADEDDWRQPPPPATERVPDAEGVVVGHPDADNDGYGDSDPTRAIWTCDPGPGLVLDASDCNDLAANVNPDFTEVPYDGLDNDCDPSTRDDDLDNDGFGINEDCNDVPGTGFQVNPNATEGSIPNGIDDDCNGFVDDGTSAFDDDGDGYTEDGGDCDDSNPAIYPHAPEVQNQRDDDCDNVIDDGTDVYDDDQDGYTESEGDCNDGDPTVNPAAAEDLTNGVDDDCNGAVDAGSFDPDGDGYTVDGGDCNGTNGTVFPHAPELPDGLDNDCDGIVDEGTQAYDDDGDGYAENLGDCNDQLSTVNPDQIERANGIDDDCDGVIDEGSDNADDDGDGFAEVENDCDDANEAVFPGAEELQNGIDDDCDGLIDEGADDLDGDGYTVEGGDCDDTEGWANPVAVEVCDGIDNNCDGEVDDLVECGIEIVTGNNDKPGCNCDSSGTGGGLPLMLLGLLGLRRRRREA